MERRIIVFSSPSTVTLPDRISSFVALEAFAYQAFQKKKKKNYAKMGKNVRDRRRSRRIINVRAIAAYIDDYTRRWYNYLQECNVT